MKIPFKIVERRIREFGGRVWQKFCVSKKCEKEVESITIKMEVGLL